MMLIDVSTVLRQTVACELYSNLVTRPTGAAVRSQIEALVDHSDARSLAVIDFSHVAMIDFSCADEVVAKLLLRYVAAEREDQEAYFLFRGVNDDHWDAIEDVLERHGLALVLETDDGVRIVGMVNDSEKAAWAMVFELGRAGATSLASAMHASTSDCERMLDDLHRRRLLMHVDDYYVAVGSSGTLHA